MKSIIFLLLVILVFSHPTVLTAQQVLYSSTISNASNTRFEVIGKAGNYYWIQKSRKYSSTKKWATPWLNDKDLNFEIYDARMNRVRIIPSPISDTVQKEYLVAGEHYFDQLTFTNPANKTSIFLTRYTPEGTIVHYKDTLISFPGTMLGNDFLLLRSQDRNKILLLGFESVKESSPRIHAILYNSNWKVIYQRVYKDPNLTQPYIQYDFINYPLEHFDSSPVKLGDNGDWFMLAPSQRNNNYLLFHFQSFDSNFIQTEIKLPQKPRVQNLSLWLDNERDEVLAGVLLNTNIPTVKKSRIAHYIISQCRVDFDTTYRFNTLAANKTKDENLFEQYFIPVPGKGFMFLKEYGRPNSSAFLNDEVEKADEEDTDMPVQKIPVSFNKNDYTRYDNLYGPRSNYDRGDLSLYYFPATHMDSCWSGIINKEQTGDLNSPYLSYAVIPIESKLIFLYNSLFRNDNKYSSTTVLDIKGNPLNEGVVFWKSNNVLDFQKARQITEKELAVPYEKNNGLGFAIIRL